jgi:hypothetical protein
MEVNGTASHHCHFTTGLTASGVYWIMGWVGPRASPDVVEKSVNRLDLSFASRNGKLPLYCVSSFAYFTVEIECLHSWKLGTAGGGGGCLILGDVASHRSVGIVLSRALSKHHRRTVYQNSCDVAY